MWDLWWTCGNGTVSFLRVLRFSPVSFIPPVLHYTEKRKKLSIFITGLHNKPQGCGAYVASAVGPFTTKKKRARQTASRSSLLYSHRPFSCFHVRESDPVT
jgi:hypothetical protein